MKSAFTFYLIIFATYTIHAQSLIPDRVFKNVFMLKHGNKYGTSFFALIDHKMYLVTARHIFPKDKLNKSPINFEIMDAVNNPLFL